MSSKSPLLTLVAPLAMASTPGAALEVDDQYPGTAVERLREVQTRVHGLPRSKLDGDWRLECRSPELALNTVAPFANVTHISFRERAT